MDPAIASPFVELLTKYQQQQQKDSRSNVNVEETVANLGGLDKIIELCLTNAEYCNENIDEEQLTKLNQILLYTSNNQ